MTSYRQSTMHSPEGSVQGFFHDTLGVGKHYEWQLYVGHQWLPIENDHVIEAHYCQPGAKGMSINTEWGQVYIDFDSFQTPNAAMKVQRVTFLPPGQTEDIGWYFRDDQLWCEYGSQSSSTASSSISSTDVEHHFTLEPKGALIFTVGSISYSLDFSNMTQTSLLTGVQRNVRRRPKFTSNTAGFPSFMPTLASSSQPAGPSCKWEFQGDKVAWTEYQAQICSFDSAAIERQYQLNQQGQLHFTIKRYSYTLDFSRMHQINNNIGTIRPVRRTVNSGIQHISSSASQPRWQFQDIDGIWKDYCKGRNQSSISSQDIELQYQQNPSGSLMFTTNNFRYELNFSAMTQRNLSTNTTRSVRRLNQ